METIIFDGKALAAKIEEDLKEKVSQSGKKPKLAIVLTGDDLASHKYVETKQRVAERIGVDVKVFTRLAEVDQQNFDGVMVQLPSNEDLSQIKPEKDVDGLNPKSDFVPATVKAIEKVLDQALLETDLEMDEKFKIAIVGAKGSVGSALVARMKQYGMNIGEFDLGDDLNQLKDSVVVISVTGQAGLIKPEMIKEGAICLDVGYPKGDFDESVKVKALFWTPVPGGVGPLTVVCLLENLVRAVEEA